MADETRRATPDDDRPVEMPSLRHDPLPLADVRAYLAANPDILGPEHARDMRELYLAEHPEKRTVYDEKEEDES